jgi:speckle-type POZ protein
MVLRKCTLITIRCIVTVTKEPRTVVKRNIPEAEQPTVRDHLEHMWKEGEGRDVTFSVCGHLFSAHRCVLAARSPVFKAELFSPMKEKAAQCIIIDDMEPRIFEALLHFVYTDSMIHDNDNKKGKTTTYQHLLVAADRYGVMDWRY